MILIRHGEKEYTNNSNNQRRLDSPLTKNGEREVACCLNKLLENYPPPKRLLCSPYLRTRQTAYIIFQELLKHDVIVPLIIAPLFSECLTHQKDRVREEDFTEETLRHGYIPPETSKEFVDRVHEAILTLEAGDWVVTHGYFMTVVAKSLGGRRSFGYSDFFVIS